MYPRSIQPTVLWVPDSAVQECTRCSKAFSVFRRKHHCRMCGGVFCGNCTILDGDEQVPRACLKCYGKHLRSTGRLAHREAPSYRRGGAGASPLDYESSSSSSTPCTASSDKELKPWNKLLALATEDDKQLYRLRVWVSTSRIPHEVRPAAWQVLAGSIKMKKTRKGEYQAMVSMDHGEMFEKQVAQDLCRTFPEESAFHHVDDSSAVHGKPAVLSSLQRSAFNLLKVYRQAYSEFVYAQSMCFIVGMLVRMMDEESAYWLFVKMMKPLMCWGLFREGTPVLHRCLEHVQAQMQTLLPDLHRTWKVHDVPLELVCQKWFVTLFAYDLPMSMIVRIWDLFFVHGLDALVAVVLAMFTCMQDQLDQVRTPSAALCVHEMVRDKMGELEHMVLEKAREMLVHLLEKEQR